EAERRLGAEADVLVLRGGVLADWGAGAARVGGRPLPGQQLQQPHGLEEVEAERLAQEPVAQGATVAHIPHASSLDLLPPAALRLGRKPASGSAHSSTSSPIRGGQRHNSPLRPSAAATSRVNELIVAYRARNRSSTPANRYSPLPAKPFSSKWTST